MYSTAGSPVCTHILYRFSGLALLISAVSPHPFCSSCSLSRRYCHFLPLFHPLFMCFGHDVLLTSAAFPCSTIWLSPILLGRSVPTMCFSHFQVSPSSSDFVSHPIFPTYTPTLSFLIIPSFWSFLDSPFPLLNSSALLLFLSPPFPTFPFLLFFAFTFYSWDSDYYSCFPLRISAFFRCSSFLILRLSFGSCPCTSVLLCISA